MAARQQFGAGIVGSVKSCHEGRSGAGGLVLDNRESCSMLGVRLLGLPPRSAGV